MSEFLHECAEDCVIAFYGHEVRDDDELLVIFHCWEDLHRFCYSVAATITEFSNKELVGTFHHSSDYKVRDYLEVESGRPMSFADFKDLLATTIAEIRGIEPKDVDLDRGDFEPDDDENRDEPRDWKFSCVWLFDLLQLEYGFADEYSECQRCWKIIHTGAESYFDHGRYQWLDDELVCRGCLEEDPDGYLDWYMEEIESGKATSFILPIPEGFSFITEEDRWGVNKVKFENGWHPGMDDNPTRQLESLRKFGIKQAIFELETSQFYVEWAVAVRDEDVGLAHAVLTLKAQGYEHHGCVIAWEDLCEVDDACWERQYAVHIMFEDCEPDDQIVVRVTSGSKDPRAAAFEAVLRAVKNGEYVLNRDERELLYEMCVEGEGKWISYKNKDDVEPAELMKRALQNVEFTEIDREAFIEGKIVPAKPGESGIKYANLGGQE